ncbi:MAG: hypothetical protein ABSD50_15820 [Smithella sp.]
MADRGKLNYSKCLKNRALSPIFIKDLLQLQPDVEGAKMWAVALEKTMLTYFEIESNSKFDMHSHTSEQITMVLEGNYFSK